MSSKTVSLSLDSANLQWLETRAATSGRRLSETLNEILHQLREIGSPKGVRSVRGTIELPEDDPDLEQAGAAVRELFRGSLDRTAQLLDAPDESKA